MLFSVIGDVNNKTENDVMEMFVTPEKVFGIAILCFFVSFAIYCCCFCTCGCKKRNGGVQIRRSVEIRTELPVTSRRGIVTRIPTTTPLVTPPPNTVQIEEILPNQTRFFNETMSKPPPTYDEVVRDDSHILSTEGVVSMAPPPTYSESIIMINGI